MSFIASRCNLPAALAERHLTKSGMGRGKAVGLTFVIKMITIKAIYTSKNVSVV
jgi:hypothetical protein